MSVDFNFLSPRALSPCLPCLFENCIPQLCFFLPQRLPTLWTLSQICIFLHHRKSLGLSIAIWASCSCNWWVREQTNCAVNQIWPGKCWNAQIGKLTYFSVDHFKTHRSNSNKVIEKSQYKTSENGESWHSVILGNGQKEKIKFLPMK